MGKKKNLFFIIIILCFLITMPVKTYADEKEKFFDNMDKYASVLYDSDNGLPTSEANEIRETKDGFIWIAGYSGLIRYDGNTFSRYTKSSDISAVSSLYADDNNKLWVGTNDSGIILIDNNNDEVKTFERNDKLSASIRTIIEGDNGRIYFGTTQGVGYIDDEKEIKVVDDERINDKYVLELVKGIDSKIYGVTLDGEMFSISGEKVDKYYDTSYFKDDVADCIMADPEDADIIYIGSEGSNIYKVNFNNNLEVIKKYDASPLVSINELKYYYNAIWICSDAGIGYIDKKDEFHEIENVIMKNSIDSMTVDHEGNIWFASSRQGVMKLVPSIFSEITNNHNFEDSMVVNTTYVYNDCLYMGNDDGLVIIDKDNKLVENELTDLLKDARIRCIYGDKDNNIWLSTYSDFGLVRYDGKNIRVYTTEDGLLSNKVRNTLQLKDGRILVATKNGINVIVDGEITGAYDAESGIKNTEILTICEGDDGKVYFGSDGGGIYVLDKDDNIKELTVDDGLKSGVILRIKKSKNENVYWIITSNSIAYMKDEKITTIKEFPYTNNFDLFFDNTGNIWVLSSNGIYIVNEKNVMKNKKIDYIFYDSTTGLPSVAVANSYSYIDDNGLLYIAGTGGVTTVNINEIMDNRGEVVLTVPYVEADGKRIYPDKNNVINVPANCKRLVIYNYALTYCMNNPKISYSLKGFDEKSIEKFRRDLEPLTYTNLSGGTYEFKMSVIDTFSSKTLKNYTIKIVKKKKITEYKTFYILMFFITVLVVALYVKHYINKKTKKLIEKQKQIKKYMDELTNAFAKCIDIKDKYTKGHSFRVAKYTCMFAKKLGYSDEEIEEINNIGLLHDIGKISIPDEILNKKGRLTDEEYAVMKSHPSVGYDILSEIRTSPDIALGARYHHERIDGKGYPKGLKGDEIPMIAQIISVADTFDAMYSNRPYRKKMKLDDIVAEMKRVSGTQLNPDVVNIFFELVEEGAFDDDDRPQAE